MNDERFSALLLRLYEAPGDLARWRQLLVSLADVTGSSKASFFSHDSERTVFPIYATHEMDPEAQRLYAEHYGSVDEWALGFRNLRCHDWVGVSQQLCSEANLLESEYYNDYLRKFEFFHQAGVVIEQRDSALTVLSLLRGRRHKAFDTETVRVLRLLLPHLKRALQLHNEIEALRATSAAANCALESFDVVLAALDRDGRVVLLTRKAEEMFRCACGLRLVDRRIVAADLRQQSGLDALLRSAASTGAGLGTHPGGLLLVHRPGRTPLRLTVTPFRPNTQIFANAPCALVFISDEEDRPISRATILNQIYKLSPAECRLADLLLGGDELGAIAEKLGVTLETARFMLKSVFRKTGTHRQSQLILFLVRLPATL